MKNNTNSLLTLFVTALLIVLAGTPVQAERVHLDITASDIRKLVVAVPDFTGSANGKNQQGSAIAKLVGKALALHGFIDIIDSRRYSGSKDADWQGLNVDYVVMGKIDQSGDTLSIEGQLLDVGENRLLQGKKYGGRETQRDDMVLRLSDFLIEEFTGVPGISRTSLAYVSDASGRKEVYLSDVLGRKQRRVTRHNHLCVSPRFSPDGNFLAYSTYHRGNQDLYITDLRQNKTTLPLSRRKGMNLAPSFSPDGKEMVATLSKDGSPDLYLMDRNSGKIIERLTSRAGINVSADYSPDGKKLVFVSDRSGKPQIYTMELNNRRAKRLTFQRSENAEPSWSPDGSKIVFTSLVEGHYQIFTMDANGSGVKQVTSGWGDYESPTWSPDGKLIAFARKRNGKSEICVVDVNGKEIRVLFKLKGNQSYPQWSNRPQ